MQHLKMLVELDSCTQELQSALLMTVPVLATPQAIAYLLPLRPKSLWCRLGNESIISLLDSGVAVVVVEFSAITTMSRLQIEEMVRDAPSHRLALDLSSLDTALDDSVLGKVEKDAPSTLQIPDFLIPLFDAFITNSQSSLAASHPNKKFISKANKSPILISSSSLTLDTFIPLLLADTVSDRADGLIPTIVVTELNQSLGLCYSSPLSLLTALRTKTGVYFSRKRGLWHKGKTSGNVQSLLRVDLDCDSDTLKFTVLQSGAGFCHFNTESCFGPAIGLSLLESTLVSRMKDAPAGSYTHRLFTSPELLKAKIMEEAQEVCEAEIKEHIASEMADLIYFALVKCVAAGVGLRDVEDVLDERALKITRRKGDAKVPITEKSSVVEKIVKETKEQKEEQIPDYHMRLHSLPSLSKSQHAHLLLRPIFDTTQILSRVHPIVTEVLANGDAALRSLTAKFDKVNLTELTLNAPFPPHLMVLDPKVKKAIDDAYINIEKFHTAQLDSPLVVETAPGVVCTRFSRAIERVGIYVPGGTAILPSTTLMLGIPAKVAGCSLIVVATPPRPDGSIAPEVVYCSHKVGAAMIVKAGGAQAVASLAYGTESVPKVDKICGPGNQYVTAAKMICQV